MASAPKVVRRRDLTPAQSRLVDALLRMAAETAARQADRKAA